MYVCKLGDHFKVVGISTFITSILLPLQTYIHAVPMIDITPYCTSSL